MNKLFLILLIWGFVNAIVIYFTEVFTIKAVKHDSKKANYNCKKCSVYDCAYRYCGKKEMEDNENKNI